MRLAFGRFSLEATDGTLIQMRYEGSAYPLDELRANLRERRMQEPNRTQLYVLNEPPIEDSVAEGVVNDARTLGFSEAMRCREPTELDLDQVIPETIFLELV